MSYEDDLHGCINRLYDELDALSAKNEALKVSLSRCLDEAEKWLDECYGCKPSDIAGYDGWAEEARKLLE